MIAKLIAIIDNGVGKRGRTCDKLQRDIDIERQLNQILTEQKPIRYDLFSDGSGHFNISRYSETGAAEVVEKLLKLGWTKQVYRTKEGWALKTSRSQVYLISPPHFRRQ